MSEGNYSAGLKNLGFLGLVLLTLSLLSGLLSGGRMGYGYSMYGRSGGLEFGGILASLLVLLIKVLWLVLIVSLIIGVFAAFKKNRFGFIKMDLVENLFAKGYACPACGTQVSEQYKFCPNCKTGLKEICGRCSSDLKAGWKCCPVCGGETAKDD